MNLPSFVIIYLVLKIITLNDLNNMVSHWDHILYSVAIILLILSLCKYIKDGKMATDTVSF